MMTLLTILFALAILPCAIGGLVLSVFAVAALAAAILEVLGR